MKKLFFATLLSFLSFHTFAQDNKPEPNSFGIQYGVNFNGTVSQAVQLSGWIKNGIEIRGALTFSYLNSETSNVNPTGQVYTVNQTYIPAMITSSSSSASLTLAPSISVVKHIPIKGNLDFFAGGSVTCGFSTPTAWTKSSTTYVADSFFSSNTSSNKSPMTINWGLSLIGGANFFFYKNLAIGADFGLGFTASNSKGKYQSQYIYQNSGINNPDTNNSNTTTTTQNSNNVYRATLTGNAGLHLTYYLKVNKKHNKNADTKM